MKARAFQWLIFILLLPALLFGPASIGINTHVADAQTISTDADDETLIQDAIRTGRPITVIVELADPPLASYTGGIRNIGPTKPAKGKKLDRESSEAIGYSRYLEEQRAKFKALLRSISATAKVEAEYRIVLNGVALTLSGYDLERLLAIPGISTSLVREYRPLLNVSRGLIGAPTTISGTAAGEGIKIGIIDTGIEKSHPFFDPDAYSFPAGFPKFDNLSNRACCVSEKVIVARAYPEPGGVDSAVDTVGHGTHVAGIAAGNAETRAIVKSVKVTGLSGIAPRAWIGNYDVFPNGQPTARATEIIKAVEDAVSDGMDVINMSLGRPVSRSESRDALAQAVDRAVEAGVVVVVAAGNSGPGFFTIESPGNATRAITVGASSNPHFVGIEVKINGGASLDASLGDFGDFIPQVSDPLSNWNNTAANAVAGAATQACTEVSPGTHTGQIAVIDRGGCSFTTKVRNAQAAGAEAAIIVNTFAGDPTAMGQDGTTPVPMIDAVMVGVSDRQTLRNAASVHALATVKGRTRQEFPTASADIMAGFSSRGPARFDITLKPDLTGPGVNVLSSTILPTSGFNDWAFFDGTSMASPHVAGAAALLLQLHPSWTPDEVKSALVTRAKRPVFSHIPTSTGGVSSADVTALDRGGGRVDLANTMNVNAAFSPSDFSFGQVQPKGRTQSVSRNVTLTNVGNTAASWSFSTANAVCVQPVLSGSSILPGLPIDPGSVLTLSVSPPVSGSVLTNGTFTFKVTAVVKGGAPEAICSGDIRATGSSTLDHLPWVLVHLKKTP